MKIGVAQLNCNDDVTNNLVQIKKIIEDSKIEKPSVIFFPENSLFMRINPEDKVEALSLDDSIFKKLKDICFQSQIAIHLTTPIKENGKVFNASIFIDTQNNAKILYRKIHLFDIELLGQSPMKESDAFEHGDDPVIFNIQDYKIGSSICYDIRFAELYSFYAQQEVDIILVPAAFLVKTGKAHWEALLRARAIESQCFVIASAQSGVHKSCRSELTRETYGHSMVINPWGEIMEFKQEGVGIFYAEISHELISSVRKQIPMRNHRRLHR